MNNIFGRNLRYYRQKNHMTQEQLAGYINVVPQTISKWEKGQSSPDINMLPDIAKLLMTSLDKLFDDAADTSFQSIYNMLDRKDVLSEDEFREARDRLIASSKSDINKGESLSLLAELYCHMANSYKELAAETIQKALQETPHLKNNHRIFNYTMNGAQRDWQGKSHQKLIQFYKQHIRKYGSDEEAEYVLLDNLIADYRDEEALQILDKSDMPEYRYWYYRGRIEDHEKIDPGRNIYYTKMIEAAENQMEGWSLYADIYAEYGRCDKALEYYKKAIDLEQKPRYTDNSGNHYGCDLEARKQAQIRRKLCYE